MVKKKAVQSAVKLTIEQRKADLQRMTQQLAAWLCGVAVRSFRDWDGVPRNPDKTYDARAVIAWLVDKRRAEAASLAGDDAELLLGSADSPGLERYRLARAKREELRYEQDLQGLVPRDEIQRLLGQAGTLFRRAGEVLQRRYGPEAQAPLDEALDQFERILAGLDAVSGEPDAPGVHDGGPSATTADDAAVCRKRDRPTKRPT